MAVHMFLFMLVFMLLSLALLWCLDWLHLQTSSSRGEVIHSTVHRLLKLRFTRFCGDPKHAGYPINCS
jgi:cytochrome c oxidase assembly factor CtaG